MSKLYIDATVPLRWGPHPPVGIPRVESAIVRQALRNNAGPSKGKSARQVRFFMINRNGEARFLDRRELAYLGDLVEGRAAAVESGAGESVLARTRLVLKSIRAGAAATGKEFDRVSASYISGRNDRRGIAYQAAKTLIRVAKLVGGRRASAFAAPGPDPLLDPDAACFISTAGLHALASSGRGDGIAARLATILHDLIPLDHPKLVDRSHARNFEKDVAWMFGHCERIITVSAHTAETARRYSGENGVETAPSIAVSRLGSFLKEGLRHKPLEPVPALAGRRFALYCSTIEIRKNHLMLLKVWSRLIPEFGERLPKLVFCGRWGWMNDEVEAYLAAHPELESHLVQLSDMSDAELGWLYAHADFGLYPSRAEGWGLGAAECLDFGLPVLISETPSLSEATQGLMPITGMDDEEGWTTLVRRAVEDPTFLQELTARIATGYLPISETRFSSRVLSLVAGEMPDVPALPQSASPKSALPRLSPWRPAQRMEGPPRMETLAGT